MIAYDFDWDAVFADRDRLRHALKNTAWIASVSMVMATLFGMVIALLRTSSIPPLRWIATVYINAIRGIPLLVLIIYVYFGLPLFLGIEPRSFTNWKAGVLSLTLFHAAFMAEVFRAGLTAVPPGQREAALSLGMGRVRAFTSITLPQSIRIAVPAWGNDFVGLVKDTSLVGIIGIFELYRTGQDMVSDTFKPFEVWTGIASIYIGIVVVIDIIVRLTERRLRPGARTRGPLARRRAAAIDAVVRSVSPATPPTLTTPTSTPAAIQTNPTTQ
jgi:His/Glu/Gln/Arg/opine family amino acid ABC transporter permease subunit